ncbi:MAG: hypothetical protein AB1715_07055, partial [Acidobacteriota bacterium]
SVNAWRNIHHFGMAVREYKVATYGEYGGLLNRVDVPSDRFFMSWDLRKKPRRETPAWQTVLSAARPVTRVDAIRLKGRSGFLELEKITGVNLRKEDDILFVQIPLDFYLMLRETDVEDPDIRRIPLDWRMETRRAFRHYLAKGYTVIDFFRAQDTPKRNFYALQKPGGQKKRDRK